MHLTLTYPTLLCGRFFTKEGLRGYRFGFNGKEKVDEVYGDANAYDFGARIYDPRLGRWLAVDPLASSYAFASPYNFALNTPIQAYDPDGRLVIFVNGFRKKDYERYLLSRAYLGFFTFGALIKKPWNYKNLYEKVDFKNYWKSVDDFVMERHRDNNSIYMDGMFTPHSTAQNRYDRGIEEGEALIKRIESGEIKLKVGETIKLVGHSHGGWHAIGIADALSKAGYNVEVAYVKNPHQPDQEVKRIEGRSDYRLVQYSSPSDVVSSCQSDLQAGGSLFVGDSNLGKIPGAEYVELPEQIDNDLHGHNVYDQIGIIQNIPYDKKGYVGPKK